MILSTIEQFQAVIPTAAGTESWADFEPYLKSAELWIKNNVLGSALYDLINDDGSYSESTGARSDENLVLMCQNVIANHAYWDAIPFLDVVQTESGFAVISANNKVPASQNRVDRLREQCLIRRDAEVELLIGYLEDNGQYHNAWKGSPAYSVMTDCLIRTANELKLYGQWEGNRKEFLQLRPRMIHETMTKLEPIFSKDYMEELIEKQRDEDLTSDDTRVLVLLKYALASLVTGNSEAAERIAGDALRYIDQNIESFDTYTDSGEYKVRAAAGYVNALDSTIYSSLFY